MEDVVIGAVVSAVLFLFPLWRIFSRAGLSPLWSLIILLPGGALITPLILAFARWPNTASNH
jgi:hypothetical protein